MLTDPKPSAIVRDMRRVAIITNMPTGHQSELFTALAQQPDVDPHVFFLRKLTPGRQWSRLMANPYPHTFVRELRIHPHFYLNAGLFKQLREFNPELIVVCQYASIAMQLVMYYASLFNTPWVFWSERPGIEWAELPIFSSDRLRRIFRWLALVPVRSWPHQVWAVGTRATNDYQQLCGSPCHNLPYYSDLSRFLDIGQRDYSGPMKLLYSGKFNTRKGVDLLVSALRPIANQRNDFTMTFMGDGPLKAAVKQLVSEFPNRMRYEGFKELDEVHHVLAEHDVLVCSSRYDGWGMVVPEAMAAGMPVVGTRSTGASLDLIDHGRNGILVDANNESELHNGLIQMLEAAHNIHSMAACARDTAINYGHEPGAKHFAQLISGVKAS